MNQPDLAVSLPSGLLRDMHATGLLSWGDVHVAQKVSYLFDEADQSVQLALALAVRALQAGSICLDLASVSEARFETDENQSTVPSQLWPEPVAWRQAIQSSPMVSLGAAAPPRRPLRLVGDLLYLERYWQEETIVAGELVARRSRTTQAVSPEVLSAARRELFGPGSDPDQELAAVVCAASSVTVIAGGPGTGKTTTLAKVLGMLVRTAPAFPTIALAAPTGKAAVRMEEALADALAGLPADLAHPLTGLRAATIHRLLGPQPGTMTRFRHDEANPLPHDVVVIDEASMVSVALMARLLCALRPQARLILMGDPDQLAPVEAGAVLADIVQATAPVTATLATTLTYAGLPASGPVVRLRHNYRSTPIIGQLAAAVLAGDEEAAVSIATSGAEGVSFAAQAADTPLAERVVAAGSAMIAAAEHGRVHEALKALDKHRLLCAHRRGPFGVTQWSLQVEEWLVAAVDGFDPTRIWYPGRPVLVTQNAADLGLFNGDIGVVVRHGEELRAHFSRGKQIHTVSPFLLDQVQTIHAMTVHKAQGSQFDQVAVVLPPPESPLLTQELLYTAITRAQRAVTLIGSEESLRQAVRHRARRASGLRERLTSLENG
ncbi:MAG: exodeoxyribonuclease V subunit alpha [Propionicimonas sp.]